MLRKQWRAPDARRQFDGAEQRLVPELPEHRGNWLGHGRRDPAGAADHDRHRQSAGDDEHVLDHAPAHQDQGRHALRRLNAMLTLTRRAPLAAVTALALTGAAAVPAAGAAPSAKPKPVVKKVKVADDFYSPTKLTIKVGDQTKLTLSPTLIVSFVGE